MDWMSGEEEGGREGKKEKKRGGGSQPPISWPEMVVKHHSSGWVSTLPYQLILGHD